jgi:hypothetical protein
VNSAARARDKNGKKIQQPIIFPNKEMRYTATHRPIPLGTSHTDLPADRGISAEKKKRKRKANHKSQIQR